MNSVDYRAERFMNNLDSWGITPEVPRPVFDGFSLDSDPMDYIGQEVPEVKLFLCSLTIPKPFTRQIIYLKNGAFL